MTAMYGSYLTGLHRAMHVTRPRESRPRLGRHTSVAGCLGSLLLHGLVRPLCGCCTRGAHGASVRSASLVPAPLASAFAST